MKFIITIDTEEDNWGKYSRTENPCSNIEQLLSLQKLFDSFDVIPTYLLTYPVVSDKRSQEILKQFLSERKCEIGTHCHPWNTPPFEEELNAHNTMLTNLPIELVQKKITTLHNAITDNFGIAPVTFRGGRFAFSCEIANILVSLGYKIDTSITPYEDQSLYSGPNFSSCTPKSFVLSEGATKSDRSLVEIPLSTGFLQKNFEFTNYLYSFSHSKILKRLKIPGILSRLHLMNRVSLFPEAWSEKNMIALTKVFINKKLNIANMAFHSTSLKEGLSPFAKTTVEVDRMIHRIKVFLQFIKDNDIENIRVSDAADIVRSSI